LVSKSKADNPIYCKLPFLDNTNLSRLFENDGIGGGPKFLSKLERARKHSYATAGKKSPPENPKIVMLS